MRKQFRRGRGYSHLSITELGIVLITNVAVIIPFKFTLIDSPGLLYNNGQPSISNYGQSGNGLGNNG
jgi:hypothetical protein